MGLEMRPTRCGAGNEANMVWGWERGQHGMGLGTRPTRYPHYIGLELETYASGRGNDT